MSNSIASASRNDAVIGPELAKSIIDAWLVSEFAGGRSAPKVAKMNAVDERYRQHIESDKKID